MGPAGGGLHARAVQVQGRRFAEESKGGGESNAYTSSQRLVPPVYGRPRSRAICRAPALQLLPRRVFTGDVTVVGRSECIVVPDHHVIEVKCPGIFQVSLNYLLPCLYLLCMVIKLL